MALYHAVVGPDGKVQQVIAGRPIGFGLDENAEKTIRAATFQPALKEGKPVPVSLDLIVSFRIYSRRTSQSAAQVADDKPASLPGPYTAKVLEARGQQPQAAQQQDASTQPAQPTSPQCGSISGTSHSSSARCAGCVAYASHAARSVNRISPANVYPCPRGERFSPTATSINPGIVP